MNSESEISTSSIKIKCHSSKEFFCRGDICFIEYTHIPPTIREYGCIELDKNIDHTCNTTIDFIHRECCSTTFCNSRLFNHDFYNHYNNRWSILNVSSIKDNDLFHTRVRIVLNMIIVILLLGLLCGIVIFLSKHRIKQLCKKIHQRTSRSRKLQPSVSLPILINPPTFPSFINSDNRSNHIIHISPFSIEEYSNNPPLNLICHNTNHKPSDII